VDVSGVSRTSPEEIKSIVKRLTNSTGVWRADLDQMSKELGHLTWVRTAVVSRVLPDGLRVRITERTPRAVARLSTGRFIWVDEEGAGLGEVKPSDQMPDFFVRGWNEAGGEEAQVENRKRIQRFLEMSNDFAAAGLGSRLSEIDVNDLVDVRAQLTGDDADIAIWLGKEDFANRLRRALKTLDERKNTAQGAFITHIDVSQGTRAVVGFDRDVRKLPVNDDSGSSTQTQEVANSNTVSKTSARLPAFSSKRSQDPSTLKRSDHAQVVKIAASPKTSKTSNQGKIDRR
jgi:cell division septal protein FtsQ